MGGCSTRSRPDRFRRSLSNGAGKDRRARRRSRRNHRISGFSRHFPGGAADPRLWAAGGHARSSCVLRAQVLDAGDRVEGISGDRARGRRGQPVRWQGCTAEVPAYPFWLKPVKAHSSVLGFMIEEDDDLDRALHACRQKLHYFGEPFNDFIAHLEEPGGSAEVGGNYAVAEELVSARRQFTLEGYVWQGDVTIYGVVDSIRVGEHKSSFSRYQYPARVPDHILEESKTMTAKLLDAFGYDGSPFNSEFFWNPDTDALRILEVNPRISKSHSPLFKMVDGVSHHKVAIDLSLGRKPEMPHREGKDEIAAKFMWRSVEADGIVKRVPTDAEIADLQKLLPDLDLAILVEKEQQLSSMFYQDSYSYELAVIFLGGDSEEMLEDAYQMCVDCLPIHLKPLPETA